MISSVAPSSPRPPGTHRCQHDVHQVMGDQEASGISASALSKNVIQETLELAPDRTPSLHIMDIAQQGHLLRHSKRLTGSDIPKIGTSSRLANTAQRQHHRDTSNRLSRAEHCPRRQNRLKDRICTKVTFSAWSITLFGCSSSTVGLRYSSALSAIPTIVFTSRTALSISIASQVHRLRAQRNNLHRL